jgi:hypothetical protein
VGGVDGAVPVKVMVGPVFPLEESHDGRPGNVQLYPGVPADAVQVAEYGSPAAIELLDATQLTFNLETTVIEIACEAVCAVGVALSVTTAANV